MDESESEIERIRAKLIRAEQSGFTDLSADEIREKAKTQLRAAIAKIQKQNEDLSEKEAMRLAVDALNASRST